MKIFDKGKKALINSRRLEEKLYEVALEEFELGEIKKGLYAKALAKAEGNKEKADGMYLKLRVQSLVDDIESERINTRENARAFAAYQELKEFESINVLAHFSTSSILDSPIFSLLLFDAAAISINASNGIRPYFPIYPVKSSHELSTAFANF